MTQENEELGRQVASLSKENEELEVDSRTIEKLKDYMVNVKEIDI